MFACRLWFTAVQTEKLAVRRAKSSSQTHAIALPCCTARAVALVKLGQAAAQVTFLQMWS